MHACMDIICNVPKTAEGKTLKVWSYSVDVGVEIFQISLFVLCIACGSELSHGTYLP